MNKSDLKRNYFMLTGKFARKGYDWWWHNFTGINEETGEERTFFVEYFCCNPSLTFNQEDSGPVLGQLPENKAKSKRPSYVMIKAGWWGQDAVQLHRFISWDNVELSNDANSGFYFKAADCFASETILRGLVEVSAEDAEAHPEYMCGSGSMEWEFTVDKKVAFNVGYGAGSLFRKLKAFEMYWHAQGMKSQFSGTVVANGQRYAIKPESSFGYADKNWGSDFTSPWVWLSSNDLKSKITGKKLENSVFDIGGGRPVAFGVALERKLLADFWYEGKSYEFNFSKFWTGCKTVFDCKEEDDKIIWHVRQENKTAIMVSDIVCDKANMLLVNYEAPDGSKKHNRLWNGGAGIGTVKLYSKSAGKEPVLKDEIEAKHIGCEWGEYC